MLLLATDAAQVGLNKVKLHHKCLCWSCKQIILSEKWKLSGQPILRWHTLAFCVWHKALFQCGCFGEIWPTEHHLICGSTKADAKHATQKKFNEFYHDTWKFVQVNAKLQNILQCDTLFCMALCTIKFWKFLFLAFLLLPAKLHPSCIHFCHLATDVHVWVGLVLILERTMQKWSAKNQSQLRGTVPSLRVTNWTYISLQ